MHLWQQRSTRPVRGRSRGPPCSLLPLAEGLIGKADAPVAGEVPDRHHEGLGTVGQPALADLELAPLLVATDGEARISRRKLRHTPVQHPPTFNRAGVHGAFWLWCFLLRRRTPAHDATCHRCNQCTTQRLWCHALTLACPRVPVKPRRNISLTCGSGSGPPAAHGCGFGSRLRLRLSASALAHGCGCGSRLWLRDGCLGSCGSGFGCSFGCGCCPVVPACSSPNADVDVPVFSRQRSRGRPVPTF